MLVNLIGVNKVVIKDFSNYCIWKCNNGGNYLEELAFYRLTNDMWELVYLSSAEFDYCHILGQYQRCQNCPDYDDELGCIAQPNIISSKKLVELISKISKYEQVELYRKDYNTAEILIKNERSYCDSCSQKEWC